MQPDANGWMLIESAPKDGSKILVWNVDYGSHLTFWDWWPKGWHGRHTDYTHDDSDSADQDPGAITLDFDPTHWQPLPDPPIADEVTK
jgi:hypothetical protein